MKNIIFIIILLLLVIPGFEAYFDFIPENPLHGAFEDEEKAVFSTNSWMSGDFQAKADPWIEGNIGFHNSLVRFHNQLNYSIFHKPKAEGVVRGKNGQLYEYDYIRAWMGKDFVGGKFLDKKLRQFKFLQQHLKDSLDIDLVLVLEPGKASVYPNDIPDRYKKAELGLSNYDYICKRAEELDIGLINFNDYFINIRDTVPYPIFPKQGTHWSEFAMWYVADSLIKYIEAIRNIDLPEVVRDGIEISDTLQSTDYDVAVSMNLIWELQHGPMPYPSYHFVADSTHQRPNVLAIADSYYFNFYNSGIPENLFNNQAFWYFYKNVYPDTYTGEKTVKDLDLKTEIEKQDVIFLMMTERFLYKFDRGFVDDLFSIYGISSSTDQVARFQTDIVNLDSWFSDVIREAGRRGISIGEMMEKEAWHRVWQEDPEAYYSFYGPTPVARDIKMDEEWYSGVQQRAETNNISVEERLMMEAEYMLNNKYPESLKKYSRIEQIMANIRADSAWHAYIIEKASHYFMTEEEMLRADAEYFYWKESQEDIH